MIFHLIAAKPDNAFSSPSQAQKLKAQGEKALERQNYDELTAIIYGLYALLPQAGNEDVSAALTGLQ
jgi:hypothetical protein